jgi:hypothetical protein
MKKPSPDARNNKLIDEETASATVFPQTSEFGKAFRILQRAHASVRSLKVEA